MYHIHVDKKTGKETECNLPHFEIEKPKEKPEIHTAFVGFEETKMTLFRAMNHPELKVLLYGIHDWFTVRDFPTWAAFDAKINLIKTSAHDLRHLSQPEQCQEINKLFDLAEKNQPCLVYMGKF